MRWECVRPDAPWPPRLPARLGGHYSCAVEHQTALAKTAGGAKPSLTETFRRLADTYRPTTREQFDFADVDWANGVVSANGTSGPAKFRVRLAVVAGDPPGVAATCSLCGGTVVCAHARALAITMDEGGLAADIEAMKLVPAQYTLKKQPRQSQRQPALKPADDAWRSRLRTVVQQLQYAMPTTAAAAPPTPRIPAGRELVYVIGADRWRGYGDGLSITLATRPSAGEAGRAGDRVYRAFAGGVAAWAASPDPLDREIAEKFMFVARVDDGYASGRQVQFSLPVDHSPALVGRLARSGRLFRNDDYNLHDGIVPVGWLGDDRFELKFEVAADGPSHLRLGVCAVSPGVTVPHGQVGAVGRRHFFDRANRLGLFAAAVPASIVHTVASGKPVVVPRGHAGELVGQLLQTPSGMGVEFVGCDDLRPTRLDCTPKPRIHLKAARADTTTVDADAHLDYDGVHVLLDRTGGDVYDAGRGALVTIDAAAHERGRQLLADVGVKTRRNYDGSVRLTLPKRKLPAIVGALIQHGWHVDADGKLYRAGTTFSLDVVSGIDWFELQGTATFDDATVGLPALLAAVRSGQQTVVLDDGSLGMIPAEWAKQFGGLADLAGGEADGESVRFGRSQVGLLDALLAQQPQANVDERFAAARDALRAFDRIQPQDAPPGFVGTLRPYQQLALGWFAFLRTLGFGGCLADDMGLGKTIQVLAMLQQRKLEKAGPSLIVVPRSLVFNWTAEAAKFAPDLRVLDQSHAGRRRGTDHLAEYDLVLSTYGTLKRDAAFLREFEFDYVILDEAQAIKTAKTEAAKAARLLNGRHRLALSGTPIENHLGELWSLFDFLNPGMMGRVGRFATLARGADADERTMLAAAVRPFILRRTKKQVAPELPDRVEQTVLVDLDAAHRRSYDQLREHYRRTLLAKVAADGIGKSQIVILEALLRLRQAACHPGLIDKARAKDSSAKIDELLARLAEAAAAGERVLVFSQFTSLLAIVKARLTKAKVDFLYLDGKTRDRQSLVEQFQSGSGPGVFLISLKAGGVGLNLTAARSVYLLDPWWNPAVEAQAIDRAHRIGQQQTVFATRLIAADTVEQKVLELQAKKKGLADAILNADNAGISSITRDDLELLLA